MYLGEGFLISFCFTNDVDVLCGRRTYDYGYTKTKRNDTGVGLWSGSLCCVCLSVGVARLKE